MCLKFLCCGGDDADDGTPASQPVVKPPSSHTVQAPPAASGQLPSPAMKNGLPSSAMNGVKTPGAAGDNKSSPQEPGKFDTARKEADKKSTEKAKQEAKANPDYSISSTTADYMPPSSTPIKKAHKKDDSAKNGGQDADATSQMNQDHRLRPSVDVVGSQANRGRINQDHERRALPNEPVREAVDNRFPRVDDIGSPANLIPRKDQPRRGERFY